MDENEPKRTDLNRNEPFWTEMDCFSRRNGLLFGRMLCFLEGNGLFGEEAAPGNIRAEEGEGSKEVPRGEWPVFRRTNGELSAGRRTKLLPRCKTEPLSSKIGAFANAKRSLCRMAKKAP